MSISEILTGDGKLAPGFLPAATLNPLAIAGVSDASSAATGYVGQVISASVLYASAVSLTTATPANVVTVSLTAGDWDVSANCLIENSGANLTVASFGLSLTTATLPDRSLQVREVATATAVGGSCSTFRVNVSTTTSVYLVASCTFASGTSTGCGSIVARRVR